MDKARLLSSCRRHHRVLHVDLGRKVLEHVMNTCSSGFLTAIPPLVSCQDCDMHVQANCHCFGVIDVAHRPQLLLGTLHYLLTLY